MTEASDNLSLIVGELRGSTAAIIKRLDQQDAQHATDKTAAIDARNAKEARDDDKHRANLTRLDTIEAIQRTQAAICGTDHTWIETVGKPLAERIDGMATASLVKRSEAKGGRKVWALIGGLGTAAIGLITALSWDGVVSIYRGLFGGHH